LNPGSDLIAMGSFRDSTCFSGSSLTDAPLLVYTQTCRYSTVFSYFSVSLRDSSLRCQFKCKEGCRTQNCSAIADITPASYGVCRALSGGQYGGAFPVNTTKSLSFWKYSDSACTAELADSRKSTITSSVCTSVGAGEYMMIAAGQGSNFGVYAGECRLFYCCLSVVEIFVKI
jgi:hypothetical protein